MPYDVRPYRTGSFWEFLQVKGPPLKSSSENVFNEEIKFNFFSFTYLLGMYPVYSVPYHRKPCFAGAPVCKLDASELMKPELMRLSKV